MGGWSNPRGTSGPAAAADNENSNEPAAQTDNTTRDFLMAISLSIAWILHRFPKYRGASSGEWQICLGKVLAEDYTPSGP
jgi:hypothetical protein